MFVHLCWVIAIIGVSSILLKFLSTKVYSFYYFDRNRKHLKNYYDISLTSKNAPTRIYVRHKAKQKRTMKFVIFFICLLLVAFSLFAISDAKFLIMAKQENAIVLKVVRKIYGKGMSNFLLVKSKDERKYWVRSRDKIPIGQSVAIYSLANEARRIDFIQNWSAFILINVLNIWIILFFWRYIKDQNTAKKIIAHNRASKFKCDSYFDIKHRGKTTRRFFLYLDNNQLSFVNIRSNDKNFTPAEPVEIDIYKYQGQYACYC